MSDNSSSEGYSATKGTDYPAKPDPSSLEGYSAIKSTDYPAQPNGRVEEYPAPESPQGAPPSKPRFPWKKVVWFSVGAIVIVGGVAVYLLYRSSPIRFSDGNIIVRDSIGGAIEIDVTPELPDSFPSDIPIFPDAKLEPSATLIESDDPDLELSIFRWNVSAPLAEVLTWYVEELEIRGWNIISRQQTGINTGLFTVIKENRGFFLDFEGVSSTRTNVTLNIGEEF